MRAIPYKIYRLSYQWAQKHNEAYGAYVWVYSGQSEKNMIVTDERGTSEGYHDAFEMSACQVLAWDSRCSRRLNLSVTSLSIFDLCTTFRGVAQDTLTAAVRFKFLQTHQRAVIPVSIVKLTGGSNTQ
jgi:hypothetical protein